MASSFLPQRFASLLLAGTALAACSSGGPVPPAEIDGHTRVGSISQTRRLEGRVGRNGSVLEARVGDPVAYAADPAPENEALALSSGTSNPDYLDTPNLAAGNTGAAPTQPFPNNASLPMIDSPEALGETAFQEPQQPARQTARRESDLPMIDSPEALGETAGQPSSGPIVIPEEGINIDAELGVAAPSNQPPSDPQQAAVPTSGAMAIAEGETDQPVVDGIGTDAPALRPPVKRRIP